MVSRSTDIMKLFDPPADGIPSPALKPSALSGWRPQFDRARGFTLIELRGVIAIIGFLAALLLPALSRARNRGQSTACLGNLRQLGVAWVMYADDFAQQLPPNKSARMNGVQQNMPGSWVQGNAQTDTTTANVERGVLYPYVPAAAIFRCPADQSVVAGQAGLRRTRSYALSAWLNSAMSGKPNFPEWDTQTFDEMKFRHTSLAEPARVFVFLDKNSDCNDDGVFALADAYGYALHPDEWTDLPAETHIRGCNLAFADGHAEHYHWRWSKRFNRYHEKVANDLDLQDLRRLQAGLPIKR